MLQVMDVADTLVRHIQATGPDDIAIVAYFGSYAQGNATERSDLDFFFIPATPDGYRHTIAFILDDISFDFWPISWERAEKMASFEDPKTSIIADAQLLYVRSEEDRSRFLQLQNKIHETTRQGLQLLEKAELELKDTYIHMYKMSRMTASSDHLAYFRYESRSILTKVLYSLALINRTYVTKGWGKNLQQFAHLPMRPSLLDEYVNTITHSRSCTDIQRACEVLVQDTVELLLKQQKAHFTPPSYSDRMKGIYEEFKGMLDKIVAACRSNDYTTAFFWSIEVQEELAHFIYFAEKGCWPVSLDPSLEYQNAYHTLGFPDLIPLLHPDDLTPLCEAVVHLDSLVESHFQNQGVEINRFKTLDQFAAFLHHK